MQPTYTDLMKIKTGIITKIRLAGEPWTDDHILCGTAQIELQTGETLRIELPWIGWEGLAALEYAQDSTKAFEKARQLINDRVEAELE